MNAHRGRSNLGKASRSFLRWAVAVVSCAAVWSPLAADEDFAQTKVSWIETGDENVIFDVSPDGTQLATIGIPEADYVQIWDLSSLRRTRRIRTEIPVAELRYAPQGDTVAILTLEERDFVEGWSVKEGRLRYKLGRANIAATTFVFAPDGRTVFYATEDGEIFEWNIETRSLRQRAPTGQGAVLSLALLRDGRRLASGGTDGSIKLWTTNRLRPLATLKHHENGLTFVSVSTDGSQLVSGGANGGVRIWNLATREPIRSFESDFGMIFDVAFSPTGEFVATASQQGQICLWPVSRDEGDRRVLLKVDGQIALNVSFGHDGKTICASFSNGKVAVIENQK